MADHQNFTPDDTGYPMATKSEVQDVARKLDNLFEMMMNSPMFRTPPGYQIGNIPIQNVNEPIVNQNFTVGRPRVDNAIPNQPERSERTRGTSRPNRSRRTRSRRESTSSQSSEGTTSSGTSGTSRKRRAEPGNPLSEAILAEVVLELQYSNLECYHGKTDSSVFLAVFEGQMLKHTLTDEAKCKILVSTLRGAAMTWFYRLTSESITSFKKFKKLLISAFSSSKQPKKSNKSLLTMEQKSNETLRDFISRFNEARFEMTEGDESIVKLALEEGLLEGQYKYALVKNPEWSLEKMLDKADRFMEVEEAIIRSRRNKEKKESEI